ncbi:MAG: hypothetical protein AABY22_30015 [Nanoarchaeota archaeon]
MALFGAIFGSIISKSWGGFKSIVGRTIAFFSIGLFLQVFGQSVFSFYNLVLEVEIPYPSLADIGYFFSIPFYIFGVVLLGKASGAGLSFKSMGRKLQAILIPILALGLSYFIFLKGYEFDWSSPLRIFLDFGYPFGQAIYVSLALLVFLLSINFLGGMMRPKVLLILFALIVQYAADYNFLYQAYKGTWLNGGYGDYIYLLSYFLMTIALLNLGSVFEKIRESK